MKNQLDNKEDSVPTLFSAKLQYSELLMSYYYIFLMNGRMPDYKCKRIVVTQN